MKHTTVSQVKQDIKFIWHKKYVSFETKKRWEIAITAIFNATFVSGILILFIMGGTIYEEEHAKELTYAQNVCQVHTTEYRQYWCGSKHGKYICYAPVWDIVYGENQTINATIVGYDRFRLISDVIKKTNEYQIGSSYPCWYDTKNLLKVQWEQPNSRTGLILLIFGGLTIIPTIISFFLIFKFCKQIRKHQGQ